MMLILEFFSVAPFHEETTPGSVPFFRVSIKTNERAPPPPQAGREMKPNFSASPTGSARQAMISLAIY